MARELPPEWVAIMNERGAIMARNFISFELKNRATNAIERLGLWTGGDHYEFVIEGIAQTYYGAGTVIDLSELENEVGTNVKPYSVRLAGLTEAVTIAMRQHNPKGALIKIHTALFDPDSGLRMTPFLRRYKGFIDKAPIKQPSKNSAEGGSVNLSLVSFARNLTRTVPSKKSDQNQRQRDPEDRFFQYANVAGSIQTPWGAERIRRNPQTIRVAGMEIRR